MSLLFRRIFGRPTRVKLTSLLKELTTVYIPAFAPSCFHHGDYIGDCHLSGDLICGYDLVLQLGELLAPPLLFDSQLNCYSDKWPINAECHLCCDFNKDFNDTSPNSC